MAELMAPGALPDIWLGSSDAPVTIIEYASMTCNHCAFFHARTFPDLKKNYINSGKVRFALREFPLEPFAVAAFMVARRFGERRDEIVDFLFANQNRWLFVQDTLAGLATLAAEKGMTGADFQAAIRDEALLTAVNSVHDVAVERFGVVSTPTFFVNGQKYVGQQSPEALGKILEPLLKG